MHSMENLVKAQSEYLTAKSQVTSHVARLVSNHVRRLIKDGVPLEELMLESFDWLTRIRDMTLPSDTYQTIMDYLLAYSVGEDGITPEAWSAKVRDFVDKELPEMFMAELPFVLNYVNSDATNV